MTNNKPITKLDPTTFTTRDSKEVAKINEIIDRLNAMSEANKPAECFGDMVKKIDLGQDARGWREDKFFCGDRIHEHIKAKARIEGKIEMLNIFDYSKKI